MSRRTYIFPLPQALLFQNALEEWIAHREAAESLEPDEETVKRFVANLPSRTELPDGPLPRSEIVRYLRTESDRNEIRIFMDFLDESKEAFTVAGSMIWIVTALLIESIRKLHGR